MTEMPIKTKLEAIKNILEKNPKKTSEVYFFFAGKFI